MAKHLVDDENGNILGGNFFCTRQFKETRKQENIIPTIVYQLARKSKPYAQALLKADEFISVGNTLSSQMKDLLVGPWQRSISERHFHVPLYLVFVDALDEVDDQGGSAFLKELLNTIDAAALPGLKFLVTSRPYPNIARVASFAPVAAALQSGSDDMRELADVLVKDLHAVLYLKDGCIFWYHPSFCDFIFTQARSKFISPSNHVVDMSCDMASCHALLTQSCFNVMMSLSGLHFDICQLPSLFLLDSQVPDLDLRIQKNIPDVLWYCSC